MGPFWGSIFVSCGVGWHIDLLFVVHIYAENLQNHMLILGGGIYMGVFVDIYML